MWIIETYRNRISVNCFERAGGSGEKHRRFTLTPAKADFLAVENGKGYPKYQKLWRENFQIQ
jgi:hypothetical protein